MSSAKTVGRERGNTSTRIRLKKVFTHIRQKEVFTHIRQKKV
ncbi:hypothetical protein AVEN_73284-1, partial [Araneus ventricosus]